MALTSCVCTLYYQTYYTWIIYYISQSFTWDLPWTTCNASWATSACVSSLETVGSMINTVDNMSVANHSIMNIGQET